MRVAAAFAAAASHFADRPFLHVLGETAAAYAIQAGPITYAAAAAEIVRLREAYAGAGYGPGHRVGLMLENRPAFFLHWFALNGLGVSVVPLNPELRPAELGYLVAHSEIVLAVGCEHHLPKLAAIPAIADDARPPAAPPPGSVAPDECALLYTSGTTGRPKGCVLSNESFLQTGRWYGALGGLAALRPGAERLLTPLPLVHMNAMSFSAMAMMLTGGCLIQLDRFHPRSWWQSVRDSGATIFHYLGVMPSMLMAAAPDPRDRDHALRFAFGAGVDRRLHADFEARFGVTLLEAWAMTETGAGAAVIANRAPRHVGTACFGRPGPAMEVRIVDDAGAPCAPETLGELLVRATGADPRAGFFTEYLKDEAATRAAWEGRWFHTGDVVRADAAGYLYFVERKKNIIRRSGENIAAAEVESVLRRHALVADVAVCATPDATREEEVLACVVARAAIPPDRMAGTAEAIVRAALEELSYYKVPGWVAFVDELPLTASQKVARGELKEMARTLPGTVSCIDTRALKRRDPSRIRFAR
ncbi:MAG TPA: AMP-binding protein [Acetobacteraceae bacterium]